MGRVRGWLAKIQPFPARPDVHIEVMFYRVGWKNPPCPPSVFVDRFWDEREGFRTTTIGLVPGSMRPYFGAIPDDGFGPIVGIPDQYANGLDYDTWHAGGYTDPVPCAPVATTIKDKAGVRWGGPEKASYGLRTDGGGFKAGGPETTAYLILVRDGGGLALGGVEAAGYALHMGDGGGVALGGVEAAGYSAHLGDQGGVEVGGGEHAGFAPQQGDGGGAKIGGGEHAGFAPQQGDGGGAKIGGGEGAGYALHQGDGGGVAMGGVEPAGFSAHGGDGGGVELGGPETVTPPAVNPGASCAAATQMTSGTTYGPYSAPSSGSADWWYFNGVNGTTYTITLNTGSNPAWTWSAAQGSCPSPATNQQNGGPSGGNLSYTPTSTAPVYIKIGFLFGTPHTYTIKFS
jgi:hypothetical protein